MKTSRSLLMGLVLFVLHADGQVAPTYYWKLDETTGTTAHDIMGLSNGTVQGNTEWQPTGGHHAGALRCNGNDARVDLGPCDITTGDGQGFTIACWFKPEIVSGTERILMAKTSGSDVYWSLSLVNNTGARFRLRTGGVTRTVDIPPSSLFSGTWYHLAGVYDGDQLLFYLNGSLTAFGNGGGSIGTDAGASATLGSLPGNALPFYGSLDDVRIYGTALSAMDVIELVIDDVALGVPETSITAGPDGRLHPPAGTWRRMEVMDAAGRVMANMPIAPLADLTLPPLPAGIYLVRLRNEEAVCMGRVFRP